jgi:hypothetical protein
VAHQRSVPAQGHDASRRQGEREGRHGHRPRTGLRDDGLAHARVQPGRPAGR